VVLVPRGNNQTTGNNGFAAISHIRRKESIWTVTEKMCRGNIWESAPLAGLFSANGNIIGQDSVDHQRQRKQDRSLLLTPHSKLFSCHQSPTIWKISLSTLVQPRRNLSQLYLLAMLVSCSLRSILDNLWN